MKTSHRSDRSKEFEHILAATFRKSGLRARREASLADDGADLVFEKDGRKYIVQLKVSSEGRSDRVIPLLSQAILQAHAHAHAQEGGEAVPIAIVAAPRIRPSVANQIREFAKRYASEVGVGAIDAEGFRSFVGFGLEAFDAKPSRRPDSELVARTARPPNLFSDLNQWMLKVMIGQHLPDTLISVPRTPIRNASQLAHAAKVSVMSASRFLRHLSEQRFVAKHDDALQIVRLEDLFDLWISANRNAADEVPARWIIKRGPDQLKSVLRDYVAPHPSKDVIKSLPRCCLAIFSAADTLGYGFVHGVPPHIYVESLTLDALDRLGLAVDHSNRSPDVYIRRPTSPETIFRARVIRDGIPISDILQVWLDVSTHPTRGKEQAREIRRRALKPFFGKQL